MKDRQYWKFVKGIWQFPADIRQRLIFADWLEEHGMLAAASRQRHYVKIMHACNHLAKITFGSVIKIYGHHNWTGRWFEIKKDSRIVFLPHGIFDSKRRHRSDQWKYLYFNRRIK